MGNATGLAPLCFILPCVHIVLFFIFLISQHVFVVFLAEQAHCLLWIFVCVFLLVLMDLLGH